MEVPVFDLCAAARRMAPELLQRWGQLVDATSFVGGAEVAGFESRYAEFLEASAVVGVANGTDALVLALRALGVEPGDEVIVPAFTFFATAEAVAWIGAVPVFADVDPTTLLLDPADAAARVTDRTVGIVPVHLFGMPADMDALGEVAERHGLWLLEDAAQAHGARLGGRRVGTLGSLAAWSFYPSKNLGCFGDGGAVSGGDRELVERVRLLANHGRIEHYRHGVVGTNSRLDALQAAVLSLRLAGLEADNARRREVAARYRERLTGVGDLRFLAVPAGAEPVYHQITVRTARRDALQRHLADERIGSAVYYPIPLHRQPALERFADGELTQAELAAIEVLSLPVFPEIADQAVDRVCAAVRSFYG